MIRSLFVSLQELNKGARRPANVAETKFRKIGVVGAGFMGAGIAYVTARAGIPVVLHRPRHGGGREGQVALGGPDQRRREEGPRQAG